MLLIFKVMGRPSCGQEIIATAAIDMNIIALQLTLTQWRYKHRFQSW